MDSNTVNVDGKTALFSRSKTKKNGDNYTIFVKNKTKKQIQVDYAGIFKSKEGRKKFFSKWFQCEIEKYI
ncbi:MAG: hypothetical protein HFI71_00420 [Lachnospiraceae bacterium]|jgi:hypothetical protein|nr:hypothetical protein [Lachnospiraceae bacterium]